MIDLIYFNFSYLLILEIFLIFLFSKLALKIKLIDYPDDRKMHTGSIPLVGGIVLFSVIFFYFIFFETIYIHKIIFTASIFIFFIGLYDDIANMGIAERLFLQILAILFVIGFDIRIVDLGTINIFDNKLLLIELGGFGTILTLLTILGFTNAINFSDGLDGLASGYIILCYICILIFSLYNGMTMNLDIIVFLILIILLFMIANFGFLFPKIFLGDNGSTSLGFMTACFLIYFTMPNSRYFDPLLVIWVAPLVTMDFLAVFLFRIINKKSPFIADRQHIHYLLFRYIKNQKLITPVLLFISFVISITGLIVFMNFGAISSTGLYLFICLIYFLLYFNFRNIKLGNDIS
ncbi:MAG: hypothetical protein CMP16_01190 [Rickettsiales bacterium]|nr:hypothetical protein [Rickettsiales bacterium]|tara:strand:- start:377 stop:1423 length:1047 start_codon:yes stop_codon:yes gene_type:complete